MLNMMKMIAEKELELKRIEAEEEIRRALYRKEVAILTARRKAAAADAKLKAIEEAILNEGASQPPEAPKLPKVNPRERVYEWVQGGTFVEKKHVGHKPEKLTSSVPQRAPMSQAYAYNFNEDLNYPSQLDIKPALTPTSDNYFGSQFIDALTSTNQQIVASLARQSLPKCHPDTFDGDPTLFHPWKASFKAMLRDGNISPEQEINYLLNFTTRDVKRLVDSYRKRLQGDPVVLLRDLWKELERRFGSVAVITNALLERLRHAAKFDEHENTKLQSFADVCADVESQMSHLPGLACLNFPNAINPVVEKLPSSLKQKWEKEVVKYAEENDDRYPGFQRFSKIIQKQAKRKNHPNITAGTLPKISLNQSSKNKASEKRTLVTSAQSVNEQLCKAIKPELYDDGKYCVYHEKEGHTLNECKAFAAKDFDQRTDWVLRAGLCFRCLSEGHRASECTKHITCNVCGDKRHSTPLHKGKISTERVNSNCTALCGGEESGVSCCKMILVDVFDRNSPNKTCRVYAILDDQSNASLISNELADLLEIKAPREMYYLTTCSGYKDEKYGRRVSNLSARSVDGIVMELPSLIECDSIPGDKREIPTPEMARKFHHLRGIASQIPSVDEDAGIHMLIGRDAPEFLKVREFRNGPRGAPWAQKHLLGWTISGQMCLDNIEHPVHVRAHRTTLDVAHDITTRNSYRNEDYEVTPCPNAIRVDGTFDKGEITDIFCTTKEDNDLSQSLEDKKFLKIMESSTRVNEKGNWEMPLPFKNPEIKMPNNRRQAETRLNGLLKTFDRKPELKADYIAFMGKISKGHASQVPRDQLKARTGRFFYLSHFPTYHNTKHTIRVVFDSSCEFEGISLNKVLLPGPDLTNNLVGVLMRFRRETVAVMCDVEQMFHSFFVDPSHRDFLRFLWFKDNDLSKPITEYRMNVHLFGNGPSPAIATYGLQKSAIEGRQTHGEEAAQFICRNFYVDDGLVSLPTPQRAINLVKRTQTLLSSANLRLHKVVSNSIDVMEAFSCDDRAKDVHDLDLRHDNLPTQRALGVCWDLEKDAFTFKVSLPEKPFTRRGVLSVVNSVYDPLGLVVPVTLEGKKILQQLVIMGKGTKDNNPPLTWDDPLPDAMMNRWIRWRDSLVELENISFPRCYHPLNFGVVTRAELHAFCDASQCAIAAAVYLRLINAADEVSVSLVLGQSRVSPAHTTSIPRLELCGAVLATQAVQKVVTELDMDISDIAYYTDSKVVLGYIKNESRRFYVYVANRVQKIRNLSTPEQWKYLESNRNPVDVATRGVLPSKLTQTSWMKGPDFLKECNDTLEPCEKIELNPEDPEVRKEITALKANTVKRTGLGADRFSRFSNLESLKRGIANLIVKVNEFKQTRKKGTSSRKIAAPRSPTLKELQQALNIIVLTAQQDALGNELELYGPAKTTELGEPRRDDYCAQEHIIKRSNISNLVPFVDDKGLLRVGGRLCRAQLEYSEKHPIILPKDDHVSRLLINFYHKRVHHQGQLITHGAIRQAGYWLIGGHRAVSKELRKCVTCKRLRGSPSEQKMADLPKDRLEVAPPFTNVGLDVFGPWTICTRRTRSSAVNSKRWGVVFTCLSSRAIHIEVIESMDSSAFICALRRFFALRGPAKIIRCDRGTNFVGGKEELNDATEKSAIKHIESYAKTQDCAWIFNPPHASHFGGVWERQIRTIRRVLDAMFLELGSSQITHELLVTLMAEVTAIVNARPITSVTSDSDEPQPLSPAMLLTMKSRPVGPPPGEFLPADLYARRRWRRVQYLAEQFWSRWRKEYIQNLQSRRKWCMTKRDLRKGDVVLVRNESEHRNNWPLGRINEAIKSEDGKVRKAEVVIVKDGQKKTYLRPVKEFVLLVPDDGKINQEDEL